MSRLLAKNVRIFSIGKYLIHQHPSLPEVLLLVPIFLIFLFRDNHDFKHLITCIFSKTALH